MLNNYHNEPAVQAEAMALADEMGADPKLITNLINLFGPATVIQKLTAVQMELENEHL